MDVATTRKLLLASALTLVSGCSVEIGVATWNVAAFRSCDGSDCHVVPQPGDLLMEERLTRGIKNHLVDKSPDFILLQEVANARDAGCTIRPEINDAINTVLRELNTAPRSNADYRLAWMIRNDSGSERGCYYRQSLAVVFDNAKWEAEGPSPFIRRCRNEAVGGSVPALLPGAEVCVFAGGDGLKHNVLGGSLFRHRNSGYFVNVYNIHPSFRDAEKAEHHQKIAESILRNENGYDFMRNKMFPPILGGDFNDTTPALRSRHSIYFNDFMNEDNRERIQDGDKGSKITSAPMGNIDRILFGRDTFGVGSRYSGSYHHRMAWNEENHMNPPGKLHSDHPIIFRRVRAEY